MNSWNEGWVQDLLSKIDTSGECHEWSGFRDKYGYGRYRHEGLDFKAHRAAFFVANGYWPELVRHSCDNPPCCNPDHLLPGNHADNTRDMMDRGRHVPAARKFPEEIEAVIRSEYAAGGITYRGLTSKYETSYGHIQRILKRGEGDQ